MAPTCDPFVLLGKANAPEFQQAKALVGSSLVAPLATLRPLFPSDFERELSTLRKSLGGKAYVHPASSAVAAYTMRGEWVGDVEDLLLWLKRKGCVAQAASLQGDGKSNWEALAEEQMKELIKSSGNKYTFMELSIDGSVVGRLLFELFVKLAPRSCENFRALCTGENGTSKVKATLCSLAVCLLA